MTAPDIADFLLACIAEDKAVALAARLSNGRWHRTGEFARETSVAQESGPDVVPLRIGSLAWDENAHIARWDPARVLAECEAKRQMVTALSEESAEHWGPRENPEREWEWCPKARTAEFCKGTDLEWGPDAPCECAASWPDYRRAPLLRLLALPYVDHSDYQQEWTP